MKLQTENFPSPDENQEQIATAADETQEAPTLGNCDELPCGYIDEAGTLYKNFKISELTGIDEDMLANETLVRAGGAIDAVLANTLEQLGPLENPMGENGYRKERDQMSNALKTLRVGDRYFLLLKLRCISLGNRFEAKLTCPSCRASFECGLDMGALPVTHMKNAEQKEFSVKTKTDQFKFKVLDGQSENILLKIRKEKKSELVTALLFVKLIELNGKKPSLKDLKLLSSRKRNEMRDEMLRVEGGVDTEVDAVCLECSFGWKTELPVGQQSFFFPSGI